MTEENALVKRKIGRPVQPVPEEFAREIVAWLAAGKSLREYCLLSSKPHFTTVYDWIAKDPDFALRMKVAREVGFDCLAEECLRIADHRPKDGVECQWQRLRIDTRLKLLAKWAPSRYGKTGVPAPGSPVALHVITGLPPPDDRAHEAATVGTPQAHRPNPGQ
jgi:hypothetical protein